MVFGTIGNEENQAAVFNKIAASAPATLVLEDPFFFSMCQGLQARSLRINNEMRKRQTVQVPGAANEKTAPVPTAGLNQKQNSKQL